MRAPAKLSAKRAACLALGGVFLMHALLGSPAHAYVLNRTVADKRNVANAALGACPQINRFNIAAAAAVNRRWNTTLGANIQTMAINPSPGRLTEVQQVILDSFSVWTAVGTALTPAALAPLASTTQSLACSSADGLNSICFAQAASFSSGVLAFTNTVTSDILGEQFLPGASPSAFIGQILDADVLFNPNENFATPAALNANAFDLESVLIHELGHLFGFSHTGVWRAMMYPFAPPKGQFLGDRPSVTPDGPLADDDRAGLRVLYPDVGDTTHVGVISGRILPVNPLSLAAQPAGVTGIFGAHVVIVDDGTGGVVGAALGGWSCTGQGPTQFDGSYLIERLAVGRSYRVYAEPFDGPVDSGNLPVAQTDRTFCRNGTTDPGWPAQFACSVPPMNTNFITRVRP